MFPFLFSKNALKIFLQRLGNNKNQHGQAKPKVITSTIIIGGLNTLNNLELPSLSKSNMNYLISVKKYENFKNVIAKVNVISNW